MKQGREYFPDKIIKPYIISFILVILIFLINMGYFDFYSHVKKERQQQKEIEHNIMERKREFLYTVINRFIDDIENDRLLLKEEMMKLRKTLPNEDWEKLRNEKLIELKKTAANRIRKAKLKDSGYIWVNEVINFEGGDDYAIRLVHPNLTDTEGMLLSTNMEDIKGTKPYLTELEGVKRDGEIFFKYWFKKKNSQSIAPKFTYAKLYREFNWVIASGVYLDDVKDSMDLALAESRQELFKQLLITSIIAVLTIVIALLTALYFRNKIRSIIKYYVDETTNYENTLLEFNRNLDSLVKKRTEELEKSENALKLERTILEDIFESTLAGYWDWDIAHNREYLSPTFKKMFGYDDHELENKPITWKKIVHKDDLKMMIDLYDQHVKSKGKIAYYSEVRYQHKNGSTVWVVCAGRVVDWSDTGEPLRMVGCHIDISERKKIEEELKKYRLNLEDIIEERTTELKEKNKKLEEFNKLFVGREFRIKELRDRLSNLENEVSSIKDSK